MPRAHRSRSRSPARDDSSKRQRHNRSRSRSPGRVDLKHKYGVEEISKDDYFLKSDNFRIWLKEDKGKYFDELSGEKARHYFSKFVKAWNRGDLSSTIYNPPNPLLSTASSQTAYKWSFAEKLSSKNDRNTIEAIRKDVASATYSDKLEEGGSSGGPKKTIGPMLPPGIGGGGNDDDDDGDDGPRPSRTSLSVSDRQYEAELASERDALRSRMQRRQDRRQVDERDTDVLGHGSSKDLSGRDKMLEKKKERREGDKAFREEGGRGGGGGGFDEVREDVLMGAGAGDSFRAMIARRDAARAKADARRQTARDDRASAGTSTGDERKTAMREKDNATMAMFKEMAKQRFG